MSPSLHLGRMRVHEAEYLKCNTIYLIIYSQCNAEETFDWNDTPNNSDKYTNDLTDPVYNVEEFFLTTHTIM